MATEALRTQLDALQVEMQRLQVENRRLQEDNPDAATVVDTQSHLGNQYAVVFVDYLTKWPEVFATPDQSAATIARLLVEQVVSRHEVPTEVLSYRGAAFLSKLMADVNHLLGIHKVNTTANHPQTDGGSTAP